MTSYRLMPPYSGWAGPTGHCGLGTLLFHDLDGSAEAVVVAAGLQGECPWCPPCVRIAPGAESSVIDFVHETAVLPGVVAGERSRCLPSPSAIIAAIERRRAPSLTAIANSVIRRLGCPPLGDVLLEAMSHRGDSVRARTIRRRLAAFGRFRPWEWYRLAGLALVPSRLAGSVDQIAADLDTEARTLRRWIRELLGVELKVFRRWPGWEWIVEAGLRRGGYLPVPAVTGLVTRADPVSSASPVDVVRGSLGVAC